MSDDQTLKRARRIYADLSNEQTGLQMELQQGFVPAARRHEIEMRLADLPIFLAQANIPRLEEELAYEKRLEAAEHQAIAKLQPALDAALADVEAAESTVRGKRTIHNRLSVDRQQHAYNVRESRSRVFLLNRELQAAQSERDAQSAPKPTKRHLSVV